MQVPNSSFASSNQSFASSSHHGFSGLKNKIELSLGSYIASGSFGSVHHAQCVEYGKVAAKLIPLNFIKEHQIQSYVQREIDICKKLKHSNIIRTFDATVIDFDKEFFQQHASHEERDPNTKGECLAILMEQAVGGDLFEKVRKQRRLDQNTARRLFQQLVAALIHLHSLYLVHRDLKAENILIGNFGEVKLCDFGLCRQVLDQSGEHPVVLRTLAGSLEYQAPEVILEEKGYSGYSCDVWSSAIVLYFMLVGHFPFAARTEEETEKLILQGKFNHHDSWIPPSAGELLVQMLEVEPEKRCSLYDVVCHPWFQQGLSKKSLEELTKKARAVYLDKRFAISNEHLLSSPTVASPSSPVSGLSFVSSSPLNTTTSSSNNNSNIASPLSVASVAASPTASAAAAAAANNNNNNNASAAAASSKKEKEEQEEDEGFDIEDDDEFEEEEEEEETEEEQEQKQETEKRKVQEVVEEKRKKEATTTQQQKIQEKDDGEGGELALSSTHAIFYNDIPASDSDQQAAKNIFDVAMMLKGGKKQEKEDEKEKEKEKEVVEEKEKKQQDAEEEEELSFSDEQQQEEEEEADENENENNKEEEEEEPKQLTDTATNRRLVDDYFSVIQGYSGDNTNNNDNSNKNVEEKTTTKQQQQQEEEIVGVQQELQQQKEDDTFDDVDENENENENENNNEFVERAGSPTFSDKEDDENENEEEEEQQQQEEEEEEKEQQHEENDDAASFHLSPETHRGGDNNENDDAASFQLTPSPQLQHHHLQEQREEEQQQPEEKSPASPSSPLQRFGTQHTHVYGDSGPLNAVTSSTELPQEQEQKENVEEKKNEEEEENEQEQATSSAVAEYGDYSIDRDSQEEEEKSSPPLLPHFTSTSTTTTKSEDRKDEEGSSPRENSSSENNNNMLQTVHSQSTTSGNSPTSFLLQEQLSAVSVPTPTATGAENMQRKEWEIRRVEELQRIQIETKQQDEFEKEILIQESEEREQKVIVVDDDNGDNNNQKSEEIEQEQQKEEKEKEKEQEEEKDQEKQQEKEQEHEKEEEIEEYGIKDAIEHHHHVLAEKIAQEHPESVSMLHQVFASYRERKILGDFLKLFHQESVERNQIENSEFPNSFFKLQIEILEQEEFEERVGVIETDELSEQIFSSSRIGDSHDEIIILIEYQNLLLNLHSEYLQQVIRKSLLEEIPYLPTYSLQYEECNTRVHEIEFQQNMLSECEFPEKFHRRLIMQESFSELSKTFSNIKKLVKIYNTIDQAWKDERHEREKLQEVENIWLDRLWTDFVDDQIKFIYNQYCHVRTAVIGAEYFSQLHTTIIGDFLYEQMNFEKSLILFVNNLEPQIRKSIQQEETKLYEMKIGGPTRNAKMHFFAQMFAHGDAMFEDYDFVEEDEDNDDEFGFHEEGDEEENEQEEEESDFENDSATTGGGEHRKSVSSKRYPLKSLQRKSTTANTLHRESTATGMIAQTVAATARARDEKNSLLFPLSPQSSINSASSGGGGFGMKTDTQRVAIEWQEMRERFEFFLESSKREKIYLHFVNGLDDILLTRDLVAVQMIEQVNRRTKTMAVSEMHHHFLKKGALDIHTHWRKLVYKKFVRGTVELLQKIEDSARKQVTLEIDHDTRWKLLECEHRERQEREALLAQTELGFVASFLLVKKQEMRDRLWDRQLLEIQNLKSKQVLENDLCILFESLRLIQSCGRALRDRKILGREFVLERGALYLIQRAGRGWIARSRLVSQAQHERERERFSVLEGRARDSVESTEQTERQRLEYFIAYSLSVYVQMMGARMKKQQQEKQEKLMMKLKKQQQQKEKEKEKERKKSSSSASPSPPQQQRQEEEQQRRCNDDDENGEDIFNEPVPAGASMNVERRGTRPFSPLLFPSKNNTTTTTSTTTNLARNSSSTYNNTNDAQQLAELFTRACSEERKKGTTTTTEIHNKNEKMEKQQNFIPSAPRNNTNVEQQQQQNPRYQHYSAASSSFSPPHQRQQQQQQKEEEQEQEQKNIPSYARPLRRPESASSSSSKQQQSKYHQPSPPSKQQHQSLASTSTSTTKKSNRPSSALSNNRSYSTFSFRAVPSSTYVKNKQQRQHQLEQQQKQQQQFDDKHDQEQENEIYNDAEDDDDEEEDAVSNTFNNLAAQTTPCWRSASMYPSSKALPPWMGAAWSTSTIQIDQHQQQLQQQRKRGMSSTTTSNTTTNTTTNNTMNSSQNKNKNNFASSQTYSSSSHRTIG